MIIQVSEVSVHQRLKGTEASLLIGGGWQGEKISPPFSFSKFRGVEKGARRVRTKREFVTPSCVSMINFRMLRVTDPLSIMKFALMALFALWETDSIEASPCKKAFSLFLYSN